MEIKGKIQTNNFFANRVDPKTGDSFLPTMLVLHITDSSMASTAHWFSRNDSYASSNYIVDVDGSWYECVDPKDAPWTNGRIVNPKRKLIEGVNPNAYSLTVEVVNQGQMPPWKQWASWARGCRELMEEFNIEMKDVVNHNEIHAGKTCPGPWFSRFYLQLLLRFV